MTKNKNQIVVEVLNSLIHLNNNHISGYQQATKETKDEDLQMVFSAMLNESVNFAENLGGYVREFGGEVAIEKVMEGNVQRARVNVKAIIDSYETALEIDEIQESSEVASALKRQRCLLEESLKILEDIINRMKYKPYRQDTFVAKA
ncbi:MAG: PA2169 family four-helix-bundle protein [Spirosomataceae bacterium]